MSKSGKHQQKIVLAVHLTETQRTKLEEITANWSIDMAVVGRRLVRHLLNNKITPSEILRKYQAEAAGKEKSTAGESRRCRVCMRLEPEEKRKLSTLANEWFYLPGELARILFELFIMGIIDKNDIWE